VKSYKIGIFIFTAVVFLLSINDKTQALEVYVNCVVPALPIIKVDPVSDEIRYDYSMSSRELTQKQNGAAYSPFPPGTDTATGGLREDHPVISYSIDVGGLEYPKLQQACLWYKTVNVKIQLSPHIYIAREYNDAGPCREAIMAHELHHVDVDREMMNKYSNIIGQAAQDVVIKAGAVGPVNHEKVESTRQDLLDRVKAAITAAEEPLKIEMHDRQAQVDSLEEYKRISEICYRTAPDAVAKAFEAPPPQGEPLSHKLSDSDLQTLKDKAGKGDPASQSSLGMMYHTGQDVPQSDTEALKWMIKAAAQGYSPAQTNLGYMYYNGVGAQQNASKALLWYTKAAEQGNTDAQTSIVNILQQHPDMRSAQPPM
jgi:hypothetical protein